MTSIKMKSRRPKIKPTNSFFPHLQRNHATVYKHCTAPQETEKTEKCPATSASTKQLSITFTNVTQFEKDSKRQKKITDAISYNSGKDMASTATVQRKKKNFPPKLPPVQHFAASTDAQVTFYVSLGHI